MPRYKAFSSGTYGDGLMGLERAINDWLRDDQPRIYQTAQSPLGVHLVVSFLYEEMGSAEAAMAGATAVPEVFERTMEDTALDPGQSDQTLLPEAELPY